VTIKLNETIMVDTWHYTLPKSREHL
jgi:hypothetical protein